MQGGCRELAEVLTNISRRPFVANQPNLQIVMVVLRISRRASVALQPNLHTEMVLM